MPAEQLTIAYVGNFTRPWCTEVHVSASLETLGHRVVRLQENELDWRTLPHLAAAQGVHMLIWQRTWEVDRDAALFALDQLRERGVRSVAYHLDRWWGLAREYQLTTEPFFRCDLVVSPDGGNDHRWHEVDIEHLWLPPGVYAAECTPATPNHRAFPHDVVFVGTFPYPHDEWHHYRDRLLSDMRATFGNRFGVYPVSRQRPIRGRQLAALYATAKVVVGDSCMSGGASAYWSDRVPETLGRGGVLMHPYDDRLVEWYPDLPTYPLGDFAAAVETVQRLLDMSDSDRLQLSEQNRALVLARDTYAHRMASVIDEVNRRWGFPDVERPIATTALSIDVQHKRHNRLRAKFALRDNAGDDAKVISEIWHDDTYRLAREDVQNGVVIDIGGNIGAFTVLAAKLGAGRVHVWEPDDSNVAQLHQNLDANAVQSRVTVHAAALAAFSGPVTLTGDGSASTTTANDPQGRQVRAENVNDALRELGAIAFVKIDCEGGEYDIIAALEPELLLNVRQLVMEFHGPGMPHMRHLDDGSHRERFASMVGKLAEYGRLDVLGRPSVGGILRWTRF